MVWEGTGLGRHSRNEERKGVCELCSVPQDNFTLQVTPPRAFDVVREGSNSQTLTVVAVTAAPLPLARLRGCASSSLTGVGGWGGAFTTADGARVIGG